MQRMVNPRQTRLFDPYEPVLTAANRHWLEENWPGVFRHVILELMPVDALREHFHPDWGRPTRELYSMAGLLLLLEFRNWTKEQAVEAYCFHTEVQYALNLEPQGHDLSVRTLERYQAYFAQDGLAPRVMHDVTTRLVEVLGTKIDQQRLDSTHVFSDMAQLGRTRLLGVALKRFLTQIQRHDPAAYANLPAALRQRYAPSEHLLFGDIAKDRASRRLLRQQVAEDLHQVLRQFADQPTHAKRSSYQAMERIFQEQCEVQEQKVTVKDQTGNTVMQNPSDPEASYDGHKGPGYQVQIAETCSPDNEVQLITSALPQTASVPDEEAVAPVLADLKASRLLPKELLGDMHYPSEENIQLAESYGVELVGPVPGAAPAQRPDDLTIDDFVIDEKTEQVTCCPDGHAPERSVHHPASRRTHTTMAAVHCEHCAYRAVSRRRDGRQLSSGAYRQATPGGGAPAGTANGGLSRALSPPQWHREHQQWPQTLHRPGPPAGPRPAPSVPGALPQDHGLEHPAGLGLRDHAKTGAGQGPNRRWAGLSLGRDGLSCLPRSVPGPPDCHSGFPPSVSSRSGPPVRRMKPTFVVGVKQSQWAPSRIRAKSCAAR